MRPAVLRDQCCGVHNREHGERCREQRESVLERERQRKRRSEGRKRKDVCSALRVDTAPFTLDGAEKSERAKRACEMERR